MAITDNFDTMNAYIWLIRILRAIRLKQQYTRNHYQNISINREFPWLKKFDEQEKLERLIIELQEAEALILIRINRIKKNNPPPPNELIFHGLNDGPNSFNPVKRLRV